MTEVQIHFDGGASPNPGNGYGSYQVSCTQVQALNHKSVRQQFGSPLTNNQAEYLALIAALKWLSHHSSGQDTKLTIFTDSTLVRGQVGRKWKCKVLHLRELVDEVKQLLSRYQFWSIQWNSRDVNVKKFGH